ncbi:MAG: glycosyltransferase family 4 protein [Melioribacteraceae bacterium]|nr:glycosyltransferase family 4 protein [Melioribacteraceae bacterium]MCF8297294.1 glycosyltransferase family 4 protein [Saprospiraceae bacterium]
MNILVITHEFPPVGGGTANVAYQIVKKLIDNHHSVIVLTTSYKNTELFNCDGKIRIEQVWSKRKSLLENSSFISLLSFTILGTIRALRIINDNNIQLTHSFMTIPAGILSFFIKKIKRTPYIITLCGGDVPYHRDSRLIISLRFAIKIIWKNADQVVSLGMYLRDLAKKTYREADRFPVIWHGIDLSNVNKKSNNNSKFTILTITRLIESKGIQDAIVALSRISNNLDFEFNIIGDGEYKNELIKIVADLNLNHKINFRGFVSESDKQKKLAESDLFILPTKIDVFPFVLLEALSNGLPIISTICGDITYLIDENIGILVEKSDVKSLSEAILKVSSGEFIKSQSAVNNKLSQFKWDNVISEYESIYTGIIDNK